MNFRQYSVTMDSHGNPIKVEPVNGAIQDADENRLENESDRARLRMLKRQQRNRKQESQHD